MATSEFNGASLRLTYDDGLDEKGKVKEKMKAYRNVSEAATADGLSQAALVLAGYGVKPLISVEKQVQHNIYA